MAFRKRSILKERIRQVEKDLAALDRQIRQVEKTGGGISVPPASSPRPEMAARRSPDWPQGASFDGSRGRLDAHADMPEPAVRPSRGILPDVAQEQGRRMQEDKRFANYLASSLETMQNPLRNERRIQRNRALAWVAFVVLVFFLILWWAFQ